MDCPPTPHEQRCSRAYGERAFRLGGKTFLSTNRTTTHPPLTRIPTLALEKIRLAYARPRSRKRDPNAQSHYTTHRTRSRSIQELGRITRSPAEEVTAIPYHSVEMQQICRPNPTSQRHRPISPHVRKASHPYLQTVRRAVFDHSRMGGRSLPPVHGGSDYAQTHAKGRSPAVNGPSPNRY